VVRNMKDGPVQPHEVFIGRGGEWGNPFKIQAGRTREMAISLYRALLWDEVKSGEVTLESLAALHGKTLVCFCKPEPCHGDVLEAAAAWAAGQLAAQA